MTRLAQMFEDDKRKAVEQAVAETAAQTERQMAKKMLSHGLSPEEVLRCSTLLSMTDIQNLTAETA